MVSDRRRQFLWLTRLLLISMLSAVLFACLSEEEAPGPVQIPASWEIARLSPGHRAHLAVGQTCGDCHALEGSDIHVLKEDACMSCHDAMVLHHGTLMDPDSCQTCHQFRAGDHNGAQPGAASLGAAPDFHKPTDCLSCHHEPQKNHAAVVVHSDQPCLSCHAPHGEKAITAECTKCHAQVDLHHGRRSSDERAEVDICIDCHQPHQKAEVAAAACPTCHQTAEHPDQDREALGAPQIPSTALNQAGHTACSSCHAKNGNHDLRASATSSCETCHAGHPTLGGKNIPQHQDCENCHNPHNVQASAHAACAACHSEQKTDHPAAHKNQGDCATCHQIHPRTKVGAHGLGAPCASCHQEPASDHGHGGSDLDCTSCHAPHKFEGSAKNPALCSRCHVAELGQVAKNPGHQSCTGCHEGLPHHPEKGADCQSCHAAQSPALSAHESCTGCHQPHSGAQEKECSSCHKKEHQSALSGHKDCTSCHNPHQKDPRSVVKDCADCHQSQHRNNPHNKLSGACSSCHQPHGPSAALGGPDGPQKPPPCGSCHNQSALPSLHLSHRGASCGSCHSPHSDKAKRSRDDCLSCHKEQRDHQPQADNCASCHLFRSPVAGN